MHIGSRIIVLTCGILLLAAQLSAAETTDLQKKLDSLQTRLTRLETALTASTTLRTVARTDTFELLAGRGGAVYLPPREQTEVVPLPVPIVDHVMEEKLVEVSGFFEGLGHFQPQNGRQNTIALNQAEVDLGRELNSRTRADFSLYYDGDFSIAWATVSYALRHADDETAFLSDMTVSAGQFDIPFGLDYQVYAPLDRKLVTMPHSVEASYGWWNDTGLQLHLGGARGALDVYAVKGLESTIWNSDEEITSDVTPDDARWLTTQPGFTSGMRLDLIPIGRINCGVSLARGWSAEQRLALSLAGVHLQHSTDHFLLKAEGILSGRAEDVRREWTRGSYLEINERVGRVFWAQRGDYREGPERAVERGCSAGMGLVITDGCECRGEYRWEKPTNTTGFFLQLAAAF
jgi:hypothetical protein